MTRVHLLPLAALLAACGSGSASPIDASPSDATHHPPDAEAGPHPVADASPDTPDAATSADAPPEATPDATLDAPTTPDASDASPDVASDAPVDAPPDAPLCPGPRNVFTLTQAHTGGALGNLTTTTLTNLDSLWSVATSPLDLTASPGSGASASFAVSLPYGVPLVPGTYAQGAARPDGGPLLELSYAFNPCQPSAGSFTLADLETDDAGVTALTATFALACEIGPGQTDEVTGCVRYAVDSAPFDAAVAPPEPGYDAGLANALDAGDFGPCLGQPLAFYVSGPPLLGAPQMVTASEGNWSASSTPDVRLTVQLPNSWTVGLGGPSGTTLSAGMTYTDAGVLPSAPAYFVLVADGVDCASPDATFTVYDYADNGSSPAAVTRLAATFQATCTANGVTGMVSGCVHYEE